MYGVVMCTCNWEVLGWIPGHYPSHNKPGQVVHTYRVVQLKWGQLKFLIAHPVRSSVTSSNKNSHTTCLWSCSFSCCVSDGCRKDLCHPVDPCFLRYASTCRLNNLMHYLHALLFMFTYIMVHKCREFYFMLAWIPCSLSFFPLTYIILFFFYYNMHR